MEPSPSTSTTTHASYRILRVPRASPRLADLVAKSRTARLHALSTDPSSFVATHGVEAALPLSVWAKRLSDPSVTVVVCVAVSAEDVSTRHTSPTEEEDVTLLLQREWLSVAAIRGPMHRAEYYATRAMRLVAPARPGAETRWHLYDLYTRPSHRGRGLAKQIVGECVRVAVSLSLSLSPASTTHDNDDADEDNNITHARVRLFTNPSDPWRVAMYAALGFEAAGRVTLHEGFCANGMQDSIPADTRATPELEGKWHTRFGLAMERVVSLGGGGGDGCVRERAC